MRIYSTYLFLFNRALQLIQQYAVFFLLMNTAMAQVSDKKNVEKLSPVLRLLSDTTNPNSIHQYNIIASDSMRFKQLLRQYPTIKQLANYHATGMAVIQCKAAELKLLLQSPVVLFADKKQQPKEELLFGFVDYASNRISAIQHYYPQLNGSGVTAAIKEQHFDPTDIDLKGRTMFSPYQATTSSNHATIMATMMAGGGNIWYNTKGAGWGAKLSSTSFSSLIPEPDSYYANTPILLQNHSYGTIIESYYGAESAAYDASVMNNPALLHVFSAGNSGSQSSQTGNYAGIAGYSNLTGNFKHAKNIITVGHTDSFGVVLTASSKGPAFDGRVKPELVAFGEDGSSGATALVSGIALVLQQVYKQQNNIAPSAALVKAILLNTADDVGATGIDYKSGYGSANAYNAVTTMLHNQYFTGAVSNNTQQQLNITVPANTKQLKVTLVWTDPAAAPNNTKALINDLDLTVTDVSNNTVLQPWVLNSGSSASALQQLPIRKRDSLNVVEQVTIDAPSAGNYLVTVNGYAVSSASSNFAIAYSIDTIDRFIWHFPTGSDHLFPGQANVLRFHSSYANTSGTLLLSTDDGINWQTIDANVDLSKGYYQLNTSQISSRAILRMMINNTSYNSNTFTISQRPITTVGFNCADSVMFSWTAVPAATAYRITQLGSQYMEPLIVTTSNFLVLSKQTITSKHFAVTPLYGNVAAVRSYTYNYETQGTGCYIRSFIANKTINDEGSLNLELSTGYQVKSISFEEYTRNGFIPISQQPFANNLLLSAIDPELILGNNLYRAVIELQNGNLIYSDTASIYHTGSKNAVIYPNPAPVKGSVTVLTEQDDLQFQLIDNNGRIVLQQRINDYPQQVSLTNVQRGIYYYRLVKKNNKVQSGILIIQ